MIFQKSDARNLFIFLDHLLLGLELQDSQKKMKKKNNYYIFMNKHENA